MELIATLIIIYIMVTALTVVVTGAEVPVAVWWPIILLKSLTKGLVLAIKF